LNVVDPFPFPNGNTWNEYAPVTPVAVVEAWMDDELSTEPTVVFEGKHPDSSGCPTPSWLVSLSPVIVALPFVHDPDWVIVIADSSAG
jgi:hypothetical protein